MSVAESHVHALSELIMNEAVLLNRIHLARVKGCQLRAPVVINVGFNHGAETGKGLGPIIMIRGNVAIKTEGRTCAYIPVARLMAEGRRKKTENEDGVIP